MKNQTLKDWEFVIIDDSPDDDHFNFLRKLMINDSRVRLYRRSENSGNIGNVKNEAIGLCRGKYVLEFDHDDEILPFVLNDAATYFDNNQEVGFIYMDCISLYENGNNHFYGDFICKGYGSYYCQKYNGKWVYVYNTPNINNITLSHLVCCPNHPRIWRKTALIDAGNYCEFLPICDDYEILLRTAITTKIAKIHKFGYIQYMNDNNNNFSLIRNGEINRIGPNYISPIFYEQFKINERMKEMDAHEDEKYIHMNTDYTFNLSRTFPQELIDFEKGVVELYKIIDGHPLLGSGCMFDADTYKIINGFPNDINGWGGDDWAIYYRIMKNNINITRYPHIYNSGFIIDECNGDITDTSDNSRNIKLAHRNDFHYNGINSITYNLEGTGEFHDGDIIFHYLTSGR